MQVISTAVTNFGATVLLSLKTFERCQ